MFLQNNSNKSKNSVPNSVKTFIRRNNMIQFTAQGLNFEREIQPKHVFWKQKFEQKFTAATNKFRFPRMSKNMTTQQNFFLYNDQLH